VSETDPLTLPFDQYQRYRLVADVLGQVRGDARKLRVLDVGGRTALLRRFLPRDDVRLLDLEPSDEPGLVLGDGSRLPFRAGSFDAVVTFDTLEHVPPEARERFVEECRRVARSWVVIAGPYEGRAVDEAERILREYMRQKLGQRHRYLEQHHDHGLPSRSEVEARLCELGGEVKSIGHANVQRWLALMCLSFYMDRDAPLRRIAADFYRFYNEVLYPCDHERPVYRHAVVAAFGGAPLPDESTLLAPLGTPAAVSEPAAHLVRELLAFDVQRDAIQSEWERLVEVNAGHLANLEGHKAALASQLGVERELRDELAAGRVRLVDYARVVSDLERDLEEHRKVLAAQLETERELRARLVDCARVVGDLERDLAGHRASVSELRTSNADLEADRVRWRRACEEARAAADGLARDLALARELEADRDRWREAGERARAQVEQLAIALAAEREHSKWLRAELAGRLGNLLRALTLRKKRY